MQLAASRLALEKIALGSYPTPVERLASLSTDRTTLWVKRDDRTSSVYGGNKVRKLEHLLAEAKRRGKSRLLTIGAAGSHHVLATSVFGRAQGLEVAAVVVPQRYTEHVVENMRADLAAGATLRPTWGYAAVPFVTAFAWTRATYVVPVGGSNVTGSMGYVEAAFELAQQVRAGELPEPDVAIVTLGSGGTVAGLAAGFVAAGLKTKVVAVVVAGPSFFTIGTARWLAARCARRVGADATAARARIVPTTAYLGDGYGEPSAQGEAATARAREAAELELDPTYTAKCFAAALDEVARETHQHVLYWHTLSSAPMAQLLETAPSEAELPVELSRLLRSRSAPV